MVRVDPLFSAEAHARLGAAYVTSDDQYQKGDE